MPLDVPHGGVSFEEFKEFVEGVGDQVELCDGKLAGFRTLRVMRCEAEDPQELPRDPLAAIHPGLGAWRRS